MKAILQKYKNLSKPLRASFWFLICSFLQKGISVITTPIFTRLMTTAEYGNYNAFNSWLGIITIFITLRLYSGVYNQGLVKFSEDRKIYSSSLQGLTLTLMTGWTVVYFLFRPFFNQIFSVTTVQMLAMLVMIWTTAVFNFWAAEQRVSFEYRKLVLVTLLVSLAKPVIGVIFVIHAEDKVTARILGLALVELIGYSWMFIVQLLRGRTFYSARFWKHALKFNLPLIPHYLSAVVLNSSDRLMIRSMVSESAAGIYSLAYSVSQIMTLFNTALVQTINPWMYQKIKDDKTEDLPGVAYPALLLIALINLLLIAFAPEIVAVFAPAEYYDAVYVIPPVAMSVYFMFAYSLFANFEFYYEKTKLISAATTFGAVLNLVLNYICIPVFGYAAAGYTTLVCYIFYTVFHYIFMLRVCDEFLDGRRVYDTKKLLLLTGGFCGSGFLLLFSYGQPPLRYALLLCMLAALFVFRKKLTRMLRSLLKKKKEPEKI